MRCLDKDVDHDVTISGKHGRVFVELGFVLISPKADGLRSIVQVRVLHDVGGINTVHRFAAEFVDQVGIGCDRGQENRVETGFARLGYRADGLTNNRTQHYQFAAGGFHLGDLG